MRRFRKAKIIVTLGPATSSAEIIESLFYAGADVFRLNFSHGTLSDHAHYIDVLRNLETKCNRPITILGDLQGPKFRVGSFSEALLSLNKDDIFQLDLNSDEGNRNRVYFPHSELFPLLTVGSELLFNDGRVRGCVIKQSNEVLVLRILVGGEIGSHKGVNIPSIILPKASLTEKDEKDLAFALEHHVDWIALSFVQCAQDILSLKKIVQNRALILAKLEKPQAMDHLSEIIEASDGVMVARGDLGVEMAQEDVPCLQKKIVRISREIGKPIYVATQMLESMIHASSPTRAEASDVATAIFEGVDGVTLSAETSVGTYPLEAVTMMHRIITRTEQDTVYPVLIDAWRDSPRSTLIDAIATAARHITETIDVPCVAIFSETGHTVFRMIRERPNVPLVCLTPHVITARRLAAVWGVHAIVVSIPSNLDMVRTACQVCYREGFALRDDTIVIVAGSPLGTSGGTNALHVAYVQDHLDPYLLALA